MKTSEQINEIAGALAKAQSEFTSVKKSAVYKTGPLVGNKYTTLDDVLSAIMPALSKNGIALVQGSTEDDKLITRLIHSSGQWLETVAPIFKGRQDGAQGWGSGQTYAKRYAAAAITGVAPDDDDDGAQANGQRPGNDRSAQAIDRATAADRLSNQAAPANRQTPQQWVQGFVAKIETTQSPPDLDKLMTKHEAALDRLATEHPQLHRKIDQACGAAYQRFASAGQAPADWAPQQVNGHGH